MGDVISHGVTFNEAAIIPWLNRLVWLVFPSAILGTKKRRSAWTHTRPGAERWIRGETA